MAELQKKGFQRVKIDNAFYEIAEAPALDKKLKHDIDVVVDRIVVRPDMSARLADSFETALHLSDGIAIAEFADAPAKSAGTKGAPERLIFSAKFACPVSGFTIEEIEPRLFSFNNPYGACPECDGLGTELFFEPELVVPNENLSLARGAIAPWTRTSATSPYYQQTLEALAKHYRQPMTKPWKDLPEDFREIVLYGSLDEINFVYDDGVRHYQTEKPFEGVITNIERRWRETESNWVREELERYQSDQPCEACTGYRLKPQALAVKIAGLHIGQVTEMSIREAQSWFDTLPEKLTAKQNEIAARILKEIRERLTFLNDVGLEYLTLSRASGTLVGRREPAHPPRLADRLRADRRALRARRAFHRPASARQRAAAGNAEGAARSRQLGDRGRARRGSHPRSRPCGGHGPRRRRAWRRASWPKARRTRSWRTRRASPASTSPASSRSPCRKSAASPRRAAASRVVGAQENNLKDITVDLPLGLFTAVTGVSGGGKSTFLIETLYRAVARKLNNARELPGAHKAIEGLEHLDKVIDIDQSPIGRTPRSNPATYTGAFTPIREWFAELPEAKTRGYKPGRFSFNVKGGRCEACQGDGVIKIEMHFLPDIYVTCDVCKGKRYDRETLEIKFKGKSIADVLDMTVEEAAELFKAVPAVRDKLETLKRVGLGYIHVGQQATTLSGGEAQRIKLSKELSKRATGRTLYILDEPTTGLHFADVAKLLEVLHELVDQGNTVIVIEHNLEVIKTADWIIDLGPEGGDEGGKVVATGTPEDVAKQPASYTGQYLKQLLDKRGGAAREGQAPGPDRGRGVGLQGIGALID